MKNGDRGFGTLGGGGGGELFWRNTEWRVCGTEAFSCLVGLKVDGDEKGGKEGGLMFGEEVGSLTLVEFLSIRFLFFFLVSFVPDR